MKLFILLILISPFFAFAQDLSIPDNPYDKADEYTKSRNAFQRERWFYEQRMYPNNFLPEDALTKAILQRNEMRKQNGFANSNLAPWTLLGPTPGYYFNYTNISGRTTTVRYNPANPSIIYIGAAFGGVWKSTNGGTSWSPKTDFEASLSSGSIAIDSVNPNIIYYGSGEATYSGASYYGRGIFKSTNGGDNWTQITNGLPSLTYCSRIVIRPGYNNILFAAMGNSGLYTSNDAGLNWIQVLSGRCDDIVFSRNGNIAYITGSGTGYRISLDGGNSFTTNNTVTMGTRNHIALCKSSPNILYIAVYASSNITVYKSTDAGLTFTQLVPGFNFNGSQAWYDFYMHVNPFDPNYAYVGSIDIWRTSDGGTSFTNITNGYGGGYVHVDQHNMDFSPTNPNELICTNDGGVWKSTDRGDSWTNLNSSLTLTQFYRIASDPSNTNHILGGTQDNGTQRTTGTINWAAAFGGDGGEVCFHMVNNQYMLGETQNNGVRRSQDGGNSWSSATSGLSGSGAWVGPLVSHPSSSGVFYTARQQVFRSDNWGASWTAISSGTSGTIRELAISRSNPVVMLASSGSTVYRSTDAGTTFTNVTSGTPSRTITSIYVHPDSSNVFYITFSGFGAGKIFKSSNSGTSWSDVSGNLPDSPTNDVQVYYPGIATSVLLAAMDVGVFMTTNYGVSWTEMAEGLPNTVAIHLDYHTATNKLRVGTHGRGVWETTIPTGVINYTNGFPSQYYLLQNYPNPFNPLTTIKYALKENSTVRLSVYDILGREIKQLVNETQKAGTYTIQFNAEGLSSGIYLYKIQTENYSETKRMILTK